MKNFLYLENKIFRGMDQIKQLRIYPPEKGSCKIIVVYEVPDQEELPQNGHELSIDCLLYTSYLSELIDLLQKTGFNIIKVDEHMNYGTNVAVVAQRKEKQIQWYKKQCS